MNTLITRDSLADLGFVQCNCYHNRITFEMPENTYKCGNPYGRLTTEKQSDGTYCFPTDDKENETSYKVLTKVLYKYFKRNSPSTSPWCRKKN